jgi:hypothetical protein
MDYVDFRTVPVSAQKLALTCLALLGPAGLERELREHHVLFRQFAHCAGLTQEDAVTAVRWMAGQWTELHAKKVADGSIESLSIVDRVSLEHCAELLRRLAVHLESTHWDQS